MTTANKITIARITLIPVFVLLAAYYGQSIQAGQPNDWYQGLAIVAFVAAALSDGLDGYVARRYNQRSRLGVVLDPIADKGLLLSAIITLSVTNWHYSFPLWFPILVIARDAFIVAGAALLHYLNGHVKVSPSWTGKTATALQMIAISLVLVQFNPVSWNVPFGPPEAKIEFLDIPVALAGFFTLISGIGYLARGVRQIQAHGHASPGD